MAKQFKIDKAIGGLYLIQRLLKPVIKTPTYAFGGGLKHGGLSAEAMTELNRFFAFDYMGCSEFETGAIPNAFLELAINIDKFCTSYVDLSMKNVELHPSRQSQPIFDSTWKIIQKTPINLSGRRKGKKRVYIFAQKHQIEAVQAFLKALAKNSYCMSLKGNPQFNLALDPMTKRDKLLGGWFALRPVFFFFTDKTMFTNLVNFLTQK